MNVATKHRSNIAKKNRRCTEKRKLPTKKDNIKRQLKYDMGKIEIYAIATHTKNSMGIFHRSNEQQASHSGVICFLPNRVTSLAALSSRRPVLEE